MSDSFCLNVIAFETRNALQLQEPVETREWELQGGPSPRGPMFCLLIFEILRTYSKV